jgi:hypothetical protein
METKATNIFSKALFEESEMGRLIKKVAIAVGASRAGNMGQAERRRRPDLHERMTRWTCNLKANGRW